MRFEAVLGVDDGGLRDGLLDLFDGLKGVEVLTLAHVLLILVRFPDLPDTEEAELLVHRCVSRRLRGSASGQVVNVAVRSAILIWMRRSKSNQQNVFASQNSKTFRKENREMTQPLISYLDLERCFW